MVFGNRFTGEVLYGSYTSVASSKLALVNVWKRFVGDKKAERRPSAGGGQSHITDGDLELIEIVKKFNQVQYTRNQGRN